jgi:hypothetical protein
MTMPVPGYPKVVTFGTYGTEKALEGHVRIDEKIDGSQFGFGFESGEMVFRSHGAQLFASSTASMFRPAIDYLVAKAYNGELAFLMQGECKVYFYAEVITKPKHNVLTYARMPEGYMVLFDGTVDGQWMSVPALAHYAKLFGITFIPPRFMGEITKEALLKLLDDLNTSESALGGTPPEGLVIKNYAHHMDIGGHVWPIFTKLVRPAYKEKHAAEWNTGGPSPLQTLIDTLRNDTVRWEKAVMHMQEEGLITGSVKDIGALCKWVQDDIAIEEKEAIKEKLWHLFGRDFMRVSASGIAEWYKARLANDA